MSSANPFVKVNSNISDKDLIRWYLDYDITNYPQDFNLSEIQNQKIADRYFQDALQHVPAYGQFLKSNNFPKGSLKNHKSWTQIPSMDKKNYIGLNHLNEIVRGDHLARYAKIISLSSGSSGQPFFWPRGTWQEIEGALLHERLLTTQFEIAKYKTLFVVAFSMGSYLAGTYTADSARWVTSKGYNLTVISPGIGYQDGITMIKKLAPLYEQVIIAGYPPFIKDLLEQGKKDGINWSEHKIKLMFASEFFSEKWRNGVAKIAGIKDVTKDTTNIFGASEGTMFGWETKEAIVIRQLAAENPALHKALFGCDLTPTLVEYNPTLRFFEVENGKLYLTAWGGVPLIKYDLNDYGGILTSQNRRKILSDFGIDLTQILSKDELSNFPMVYVLGRADFAASIYGVLIYPEYIKYALEDDWERLTGKFTVDTKNSNEENPELIIHVELKENKNITHSLAKHLETLIKSNLEKRSREYSALVSAVGIKAYPHVVLHRKGEGIYFGNGIKHKWIVR